MSTTPRPPRAPEAFDLNDPALKLEAAPPDEQPITSMQANLPLNAVVSGRHRFGWGSLFLGALTGLLLLAATLWIEGLIMSLTARQDWLGWTATALLLLAVFAFSMMILREVVGLARLAGMTARRMRAQAALGQGDAKAARGIGLDLRKQFASRPELAHGLARLKTFDADILDARQTLALAERELIAPLDREARAVIAATARRVSVVTAISPMAVVDVGFVAYENFRMLRLLATLYGGRPGFFAMLRVLRLVAGHLAVTGGLALADDFIPQLVGQGLTARLSARLGEGMVNGAFTVRIGLAAVDVLRPLPYLEASPPRVRDFLADVFRKAASESGEQR